MRAILISFLILAAVSCKDAEHKLFDNKTIREVFTEAEIEDLQLLYDFFTESICSEFGGTENIIECYEKFLEKSFNIYSDGNFEISIPFDSQLKIYEQISSATFDEIWAFAKSWRPRNQEDTLKMLDINTQSKYGSFLEETSITDKIIKGYFESLTSAGSISPTLIEDVYVNYRSYNIKDIRVRFIIAIHYLTLNDVFNRNESFGS
jgi:uncharacterized membrane protein